MGVSIIKSMTGHFIIVPASVISKSELEKLIDEGKKSSK
jgi:hypothetical protein